MPSLFVRTLTAHQWIYEHSGGLIGHRLLLGNPTLLLHMTGAQTGRPRTTALTYARDGQVYLVVASNGGSPRPPAWLANLKAIPDVRIQVGRKSIPVSARVTYPDDADYADRWQVADTVNQGRYSHYQRKTSRPIAIVELAPRARG